MSGAAISNVGTFSVAVGPEIKGAGSWNWVGIDLINSLNADQRYQAFAFENELPECDVCIFVKWLPELSVLKALAKHSAIIFCPIDAYGSGTEIDADWQRLRCCDLIVIHSPVLEKYFRGYAKTAFLHHHLKYSLPTRDRFVEEGPILWAGLWGNLPPVVNWVNEFGVQNELVILTNFSDHRCRTATDFGFRSPGKIRIEEWSAECHLEYLKNARAAIDIKGTDFRQRSKPPAKALDFIASGIPLAMNSDSGPVRYLDKLGFRVSAPDQTDFWFSRKYWEQTCEFGLKLYAEISQSQIMNQWTEILTETIGVRGD